MTALMSPLPILPEWSKDTVPSTMETDTLQKAAELSLKMDSIEETQEGQWMLLMTSVVRCRCGCVAVLLLLRDMFVQVQKAEAKQPLEGSCQRCQRYPQQQWRSSLLMLMKIVSARLSDTFILQVHLLVCKYCYP